MNIYVLRHGQTNYNVEGRFQGQVDIKMNEKEERQTNEIAQELKKIDFDIIFCSPLTRTIDTAKKIDSRKIKIDKRIIERSFGLLEGKKGISDYENRLDEFKIESIQKLIFRVNNFLDEVMEQYKNQKNILIVTHEGIAQIINLYFNKNIKDFKQFRLETGKYQKYEI